MSGRLPTPPSDLTQRGPGRRFWKLVTSEWDCSPTELALLVQTCRAMDELEVLRRAVAKEGATVRGSRGQRRVHPAMAELRQSRGELRRLLDALGIPQPLAGAATGVEGVVSLTSRRAKKAAQARWAKRGGAGHA